MSTEVDLVNKVHDTTSKTIIKPLECRRCSVQPLLYKVRGSEVSMRAPVLTRAENACYLEAVGSMRDDF